MGKEWALLSMPSPTVPNDLGLIVSKSPSVGLGLSLRIEQRYSVDEHL